MLPEADDPAPQPDEEAASEVDVRAELLAVEARLGSSPETRSAGDCMRALARASRAYLIYDPANEVIRTFLEDVRASFQAHLGGFGALDLQVRPFELLLGEHIVYREMDWERSLAFKLFRDGVRRLTIGPAAPWDELVQFLAILSIRYVGVHLDEDDVLTLLWKASFDHITIEAVEGFVPSDDEDDPDLAASGAALGAVGAGFQPAADSRARAPADFDLPAPVLERSEAPRFVPVDEQACATLREEYGSRQLPEDLVQLVAALLLAVENPGDPLCPLEAEPFLAEVRDFLLNEEEVDLLLRVARRMAGARDFGRHAPADQDAMNRLVDSFASVSSLRRILATVPESATTPPPAYQGLLELVGGDPLPTLFELLELERGPTARRFTRQLIEAHMPRRVDDVKARFAESTPRVAADLLRVLASGAESESRALLTEVIHRGAPEVKLEFLGQIGRSAERSQRSFLVLLLAAPEEEVRIRALEVVAGLGEKGGWSPVHGQFDSRVAEGASSAELDALGATLARLDPERALAELVPVVQRRSFLRKFRPKEVRARRVGVAALVALAARRDARKVLLELTGGSDEVAALARDALEGTSPDGSQPAEAPSRPAPSRPAPSRPAPSRPAPPRPAPARPAPARPAPARRGGAASTQRGGPEPTAGDRPPWERSLPGAPVPKAPAPKPSPTTLPLDALERSFEFEFEIEDPTGEEGQS